MSDAVDAVGLVVVGIMFFALIPYILPILLTAAIVGSLAKPIVVQAPQQEAGEGVTRNREIHYKRRAYVEDPFADLGEEPRDSGLMDLTSEKCPQCGSGWVTKDAHGDVIDPCAKC